VRFDIFRETGQRTLQQITIYSCRD
jgi:hypothetical protein